MSYSMDDDDSGQVQDDVRALAQELQDYGVTVGCAGRCVLYALAEWVELDGAFERDDVQLGRETDLTPQEVSDTLNRLMSIGIVISDSHKGWFRVNPYFQRKGAAR